MRLFPKLMLCMVLMVVMAVTIITLIFIRKQSQTPCIQLISGNWLNYYFTKY